MAATGNDDSDEVLESTSCSGVLSAEGLAPRGARESVRAPDTVGVSAGSGCWSAVSQTGGQRASEAQSSGGCESESSVSPRLGSVLWGLLQRHRSHWGGGWEAPLLRPNRLRRPRPLPPSRGGSGSPQSGRGHVHAARKSGVRNASVRTRRRGQTLLRARPGRRGELVRLGMYLRERRVTTPHSPDEGWRLRATTEKITKENRGRLLTPRERKKNCPEELGHHDPTGGKTKQQTKNKNGQRPGAARTRAGEAGLLSPTGPQGKKRETRA